MLTKGTHRITLGYWQGKLICWNGEKDALLRARRGIGFSRAASLIRKGRILDVIKHWNPLRYPNQDVFVLDIENYAYFVPFVETETEIFLKTIYPERRATKHYLRGH